MYTGRPRGLAAMLTLVLGAGTVAGAGLFASPALAASTGSYSLDTTALSPGQQVTLTQTAFQDDTPDTVPTITVAWGDGGTTSLESTTTSVKHTYASAGSFPVTVKIADDGAEPVTVTNATVTVSSGTFKFNPTWNWTWPDGGHEANLQLGTIPSNTTRVWVAWGDGETSLVNKANTSVKHYYGFGTFTAKVTLESPQGKVEKSAGTYTLKADTYAPTASLKVPSSPSKASSWKTIQGTASDAQIGMDAVGVQLWKWTGSTDYYYNFSTSKWVKYTPGSTNIPSAALKWVGVSSSGVWKVNVAGLSKNYYLEVDYVAVDKAGNDSGLKYRVQKLTS
ncbi:PKD domain-containing protein [Pseudosporangium ferrugineum]|uniref:PKD domain-containing protein n=1 Tax=Pseudosporangium ferrugineum TaxID=439699 RepID=A0A2T0S5R7_9ACTN|nr:PKD domain-containing protein [Pseudosporangium ferrugineum]PRY28759.1 hypothetical protein CLV70_10762 [Pseudosporangium ferrugineum]